MHSETLDAFDIDALAASGTRRRSGAILAAHAFGGGVLAAGAAHQLDEHALGGGVLAAGASLLGAKLDAHELGGV